MTRRRRFRELAKVADENGFSFHSPTHGGHLKWCDTKGNIVITPSTSSDVRGIHNTRAQMRRLNRQEEKR